MGSGQSRTSFTASSLNSRLKVLLCPMVVLRFQCDTYLGVHETQGSPCCLVKSEPRTSNYENGHDRKYTSPDNSYPLVSAWMRG
jgi:hypothetical protein